MDRTGGAATYDRVMRRRWELVALALFAVSCSGPAEDASGSEIYQDVCASCHARDLQGRVGPALGEGSPIAAQSDEYVIDVIANGRGSMPAFGRTLSEAQIDRLVSFLREEQSG